MQARQQPRRWSWFMRSMGSISAIRIAAIIAVLLILAIAVIQSRYIEEADEGALTATKTFDPLAAELARCRIVTAEQLASDDTCRRVWAENRRRFFTPAESETR